jgi:hypothetical protein
MSNLENIKSALYVLASLNCVFRNQILQVSGVFGHSPELDGSITSRCDYQAGRLSGGEIRNGVVVHTHCAGPIQTLFYCCFCYKEYPEFILEQHQNDGSVNQWSKHIATIGKKENHINGQQYWFCVPPREEALNTSNTKLEIGKGTSIVVVTGKFGHGDVFQSDVERFCNKVKGISILESKNVHCFYKTPNFVLQDERFRRHLQYHQDPNDTSAKGGGYWIHKSLLVRHHMDLYKDNDIIVWVDTDRIDFFGKVPSRPLWKQWTGGRQT